jgi:glycosyltransferase involved in cell wall biosynthesis
MEQSVSLPLVSVVIPTYNRAGTLAATLDSVLAQTYPRVEIIVCDDGSTDGTASVLAGYGPAVRFKRKTNGGVASARNAGIAEARGELIALMDSDDLCSIDRIALQAACFSQFPDIVLCSSDFSALVDGRMTSASHIAAYYGKVRSTPGGVNGLYSQRSVLERPAHRQADSALADRVEVLTGRVYESMIWGNIVHPPTVMVRRDVFDKIGYFDESIPIATEYDWLIRASRLGPFAYLDRPLLNYRYSRDQISGSAYSDQVALDTVAALRKVELQDPQTFQKHRKELQWRIGECYQMAAEAGLERDKIAAARNWCRGVACGAVGPYAAKVLAKIVTPRVLLQARRQMRSGSAQR